MPTLEQIYDSGDASLYDVRSTARGPPGALPLTPEMLLHPALGRFVRLVAERRHGLGPGGAGRARSS